MSANLDPRKAFELKLAELGGENERIVAVSCDSASGGGLSAFFEKYPERSIEAGISEQAAVSICAAMSVQGFIPVLVAINPFLTMRAYEQIRDDIGYMNSNVKIAGSGGGLAYSTLGSTHIAIEDIALMSTVPNLTILSPGDADETGAALEQAFAIEGPVYIRMPRQARPLPKPSEDRVFVQGKAEVLRDGKDAAIFAYGPRVSEAMKAAEILEQEGVGAAVVGFLTVKPLDKDIVLHYASSGIPVFTVEEHIAAGGLGAAVSQEIATSGVAVTVDISAIPMGSKQTGPYEELVDFYGLSGEKLAERIRTRLKAPVRLL